jgi:hypothetical protein
LVCVRVCVFVCLCLYAGTYMYTPSLPHATRIHAHMHTRMRAAARTNASAHAHTRAVPVAVAHASQLACACACLCVCVRGALDQGTERYRGGRGAGELQRLVCECSLQTINLSGNNLGDRVVKSLCHGLRCVARRVPRAPLGPHWQPLSWCPSVQRRVPVHVLAPRRYSPLRRPQSIRQAASVCACACACARVRACVRVCMLVRVCSADSCCTSISLTKNNIGADGAGALGALLRDNTVLQSLDISAPAPHTRQSASRPGKWFRVVRLVGWNGVGARGAAALAVALAENTCVLPLRAATLPLPSKPPGPAVPGVVPPRPGLHVRD